MHRAKTANRRSGSEKYLLVLALIVGLVPQAAAQSIPLQAGDAQVTDAGNLQYSLTSAAAQPATAWSVTVIVTDLNGRVIRQTAITLDEYRAEAAHGTVSDADIAPSLLRPRRTRRFEFPGPFDPRLLVTVTPAAIVFLDGSSVGDAVLIESIFNRRAEERDASAEMLRQLLDVQTHYVGAPALREALARLSHSVRPDPRQARQRCQKNLREALARSEANDSDPMTELSRQIEIVRREYDVAARHATARKEP